MSDQRDQIKFYEDRYYRDHANLKHNLSFAGCGFLGLYHVGVCCCMKKLAPHLYQNKQLSGSSAGAIAAVCLVCDVNIAECVQYMCELMNNARRYVLGPFDPRFRITEHLREGLSRILPSDAHVVCSGRLSISLTCYATHKNVVVNQFRDKNELINAILCSAYIPIFSGYVPPTFRGQPVLDGGFSDNLLCIDKMTIRVSPFAGDADICPLDAPWNGDYPNAVPQHVEDVIGSISFLNNNIRLSRTNIRRLVCMVWPMSSDESVNLACQGFEDARRFLITRGFIACRLHRHLRFSVSSVSSRSPVRLNAPPTTRRFRRNTSMQTLSTNHTDLVVRKRNLSGTDSFHQDICRPPGPSPRCSTVTSPGRSSSGLGWNVPECTACQEELHRATQAKMPAFLVTIIRGDENLKHGAICPWWRCSLTLVNQGWMLLQGMLQSSASSLNWFGHRMFYLPLLLQLDLLIRIMTTSINLCGKTSQGGPVMQHLLSALTHARDWLTTGEQPSRQVTIADTVGPTSTNATRRPNARHESPSAHPRHLSQAALLGESCDLACRLTSAILNGTADFSDRILGLRRLNPPDAADCGLEMFGAPSKPFLRQLNQCTVDRNFSTPRFFIPSAFQLFTDESGHSDDPHHTTSPPSPPNPLNSDYGGPCEEHGAQQEVTAAHFG